MNKLKTELTQAEIAKLNLLKDNVGFQNAVLEYEKKLREKYGLDPNQNSDNFTSDMLGTIRTIIRSFLGK